MRLAVFSISCRCFRTEPIATEPEITAKQRFIYVYKYVTHHLSLLSMIECATWDDEDVGRRSLVGDLYSTQLTEDA
ncbi:hypothetical protein BHE74_00020766 [Ensete ventricosum]|nr:hypothetical protein BHE74_00020766 [Ensete ventricosum]RZS16285.1 hypothetical protein BHM03_00048257 [Ensete ventricosum]